MLHNFSTMSSEKLAVYNAGANDSWFAHYLECWLDTSLEQQQPRQCTHMLYSECGQQIEQADRLQLHYSMHVRQEQCPHHYTKYVHCLIVSQHKIFSVIISPIFHAPNAEVLRKVKSLDAAALRKCVYHNAALETSALRRPPSYIRYALIRISLQANPVWWTISWSSWILHHRASGVTVPVVQRLRISTRLTSAICVYVANINNLIYVYTQLYLSRTFHVETNIN